MTPDPSTGPRTRAAGAAPALVLGRNPYDWPWDHAADALPAADGPDRACAPSPAVVPSRRRVLCADRSATAAEALAAALRLGGFDARACADGPAALVEVTDFRPHACVLDLDLPGVGGCELAQWVRAVAGGLVFLVGLADRTGGELDRAAAEAGFDLVFARPADSGLLIGLLAGHAGR